VKLELRGITKRFGPLVANDHIDLVVEPGQIHCLLGENGAGKSTLMNVLYGLYQPDEGEILVDDVPVTFSGPGDAIAAGIGMVHQHFMLIPVFTVTENVVLGHEDVLPGGFLDHRKAREQVIEVSRRYRLDVPPDALVADIAVGVQQRVEIIKALIRDAKVLILDEPTAVLTPQEIDELLAIVRRLRDGGTGIVFITHKLKEVRAVADKITVLRRGKVVGSATPDTPIPELAAMMVGRAVRLEIEKEPANPGEPVLDVQNLRVIDPNGAVLVDDVSFTVRGGEIYALAGVQGNGQTELTEAIIGLVRPDGGRVLLDGRDVTSEDVHDVLAGGVGYVPEDRLHDGLVGPFSVAENLVLDLYDKPPYGQGFALNLPEIHRNAQTRVDEFDVRTSGIDAPAQTLSGGNQQKVVLAREMSRPLRLLMVAQPTRGLDVGSMEFVHRRIVAERDRGTAVVLVSTELDEVLGLADRIAVMYRGKIIGELPANADDREIGLLMAGQTQAQADAAAAAGDGSAKAPDEPQDTPVPSTPQEG
jgi:general nucleoside transport system ATP-binding protein